MDELHVHIRAMTQDDRGTVFNLAEDVLRPLAAAAGHADLFHDEEFLDLLERGEAYVAESPREPVEIAGFVIIEADPDTDALNVRCVCVGPAFEGQHVGHRLLDWAEGLAYSRDLTRLTAALPDRDERSLHLYHQHGFVPATGAPATESGAARPTPDTEASGVDSGAADAAGASSGTAGAPSEAAAPRLVALEKRLH